MEIYVHNVPTYLCVISSSKLDEQHDLNLKNNLQKRLHHHQKVTSKSRVDQKLITCKTFFSRQIEIDNNNNSPRKMLVISFFNLFQVPTKIISLKVKIFPSTNIPIRLSTTYYYSLYKHDIYVNRPKTPAMFWVLFMNHDVTVNKNHL